MKKRNWKQAYFQGCDGVSLDSVRGQALFDGLQTTIEGLRVENALLTKDLAREVMAYKGCAKRLRKAQEKIRRRVLARTRRLRRGQADEG